MNKKVAVDALCAINPDETPEQYSYTLNMDIGLLNTELHDSCGISPVVFAYPFGALCRESLPVLLENELYHSFSRLSLRYFQKQPKRSRIHRGIYERAYKRTPRIAIIRGVCLSCSQQAFTYIKCAVFSFIIICYA